MSKGYDAVLMDIQMPVMNAHIAKPFQPEQLYKLLEQLV